MQKVYAMFRRQVVIAIHGSLKIHGSDAFDIHYQIWPKL